MARVISVCNQKGGTAKTATALNLGVGLARKGKKVLLVDNDPQADLTSALGWNGDDLENSLGRLMYLVTQEYKPIVQDAVLHHAEGVDLIPSNLDLSSMETQLVNAMSREKVLSNLLESVKKDYDYIIIDCMPSLGMLTINALTAADSVLIPVQSQYLPAKGMTQLLRSIEMVRNHTNSNLKIDGILMTLVDYRTNLSKEVINTIRTNYGMKIRIFDAQIPVAVKAAEASKAGQSIFAYDNDSKPAKAYEALTKEVTAVAVHADINDAPQSVRIPKIGTEAALVGEEVRDIVSYDNLIPGSYVMKGWLVDQETGKKLEGSDGETHFEVTEDSRYGVVTVTLTISHYDTCGGHKLTAFEECYFVRTTENGTPEKKLVGEHKDKNDKKQTVRIPSNGPGPKTGDNTLVWLYVAAFVTAFGGMLTIVIREYIRRRRQNKEDADMFV